MFFSPQKVGPEEWLEISLLVFNHQPCTYNRLKSYVCISMCGDMYYTRTQTHAHTHPDSSSINSLLHGASWMTLHPMLTEFPIIQKDTSTEAKGRHCSQKFDVTHTHKKTILLRISREVTNWINSKALPSNERILWSHTWRCLGEPMLWAGIGWSGKMLPALIPSAPRDLEGEQTGWVSPAFCCLHGFWAGQPWLLMRLSQQQAHGTLYRKQPHWLSSQSCAFKHFYHPPISLQNLFQWSNNCRPHC